MRYREPFTLYARQMKDGRKVWYYRTYDEYGQRTTGRSTGKTSKTSARRLCMELYRQGRLTPTDVDEQRRILDQRLVPAWGSRRLSVITPTALNSWMLKLRDEGLSAKRINNIAGCLRTMLEEAVLRGQLHNNPFKKVRLLGTSQLKRDLFTIEEVTALFAEDAIGSAWNGHLLYRAANILAAATGCRQGELSALQDEDGRDGYIHIGHSWHSKPGLYGRIRKLQSVVGLGAQH